MRKVKIPTQFTASSTIDFHNLPEPDENGNIVIGSIDFRESQKKFLLLERMELPLYLLALN